MDELASTALAALTVRITRVFPAQIRASLEKLTDDEIWWRPNEGANSAGNLVLHLTGSLNHYLNRNIGGLPYDRNREAEFAERRQIPRAELLSLFEAMVANAIKTLDKVDSATLGGPSTDPERNNFLIEDLISIVSHVATHTGQIVWITKMLEEGSLRELWMKTHKHEGGWKA
jgi:uncharacterized damage-inducible protein DinB